MEKINISTSSMQENYEAILGTFADYLQAVGYQFNTQKNILKGVEKFILWADNQGISELNQVQKKDIKNYQIYLENRPNQRFKGGLSSAMINRYLWTISVLFKLLEQEGKLHQNPLSGYLLPPVTCEKRAILSLLEIKELYQVCDTLKERCTLHIYYGLGLRRSEGEALNLQDVDYKNGWLYIRKSKNGQGRNMPLTASIQSDFKNYVLHERPSLPNIAFLLNKNGSRLSGSSSINILKKLLQKTQITKEIDLHCLRHSIASHLIHQGMKMEQVQAYLGHQHLESTQRYIHYDHTKLFKDQPHSSHSQDL